MSICHRVSDLYTFQTMNIDFMNADMGGTELLNALVNIFRSRRRDIPTCIFVLTDGEVRSRD